MPPPPRPLPIPYTTKLYLKVHAKTVCEKAIEDAAKEINDIKQKTSNEVVDCTVSCDGSWQRRGVLVPKFVATVSMDTGKVLDIEPLSKMCHTSKDIGNSSFKDRSSANMQV
jgi:hypothetical protein